LSKVLRSRRGVLLTELKLKERHLIPFDMDQEEVGFVFRQYGLVSAPVVDADRRLLGVISDGDLRRLLAAEPDSPDLLSRTAERIMKPDPKTIEPGAYAIEALERMEDHKITALFLCDEEGRVAGVVHLHDLWGLQLSSAQERGG
jgi:CBS domain-containing protein